MASKAACSPAAKTMRSESVRQMASGAQGRIRGWRCSPSLRPAATCQSAGTVPRRWTDYTTATQLLSKAKSTSSARLTTRSSFPPVLAGSTSTASTNLNVILCQSFSQEVHQKLLKSTKTTEIILSNFIEKIRRHTLQQPCAEEISYLLFTKAGDACAILRVHAFLEHWGLINFNFDVKNHNFNSITCTVDQSINNLEGNLALT